MKIAVNLLPFRKQIAGAGKYAQKIIRELSSIDNENEYFLFVSEQGKKNFATSAGNFHFITASFNPEIILIRILWEQFIFPFKLRKLKPDIIFTPSVAIPLLFKGKFFTTIHDVAYKKSKNKYSLLRRKYVKLVTTLAAKRSSILFTVSDFSKKEIEREFHLKNEKVFVTYNGVDEIFFKEYSIEEKLTFKKAYNLPDDFILYVGAIEPGKNLDKLFFAFSEFLLRYRLKFYLVLTSGIGWQEESLINLLDKLRIKDKIVFLPYIPEKELPILYKCSRMLAYLSSYEGFGLPVLEALAAGTPVITSKSDAIIEFAGRAVVSVNPDDIEEIVTGMYKIINDEEFIIPKINEGKKISQQFRWIDSAKIIYEQIIAQLPDKQLK